MENRQKIVKRIAAVLFAAIFLYALLRLGMIFWGYHQGTQTYHTLSKQYTLSSEQERQEMGILSANAGNFTPPISVNFEALQAENSHVVGWLYGSDSSIDYPVMQGEDNEYYLHHMMNGRKNSAGSLFLDAGCGRDFQQQKNIIYGHNMKNGAMLGTLKHYTDQEYYEAHPTLWLLTPTENFRVDLLAGVVVADDDPLYQLPSTEDMPQWLADIRTRSTFQSLVPEGDWVYRLLILSTCTSEYRGGRYIVVGRMVPCISVEE